MLDLQQAGSVSGTPALLRDSGGATLADNVARPPREGSRLKPKAPEVYHGERDKLELWEMSVNLYLSAAGGDSVPEQQKVAAVASLLGGEARAAFWDFYRLRGEAITLQEVFDMLQKRFSDPAETRRAWRELTRSGQGKLSVNRWMSKLQMTLSKRGMGALRQSEQLQVLVFITGLRAELQSRMIHKDYDSLEEAVVEASRLEAWQEDRDRERQSLPFGRRARLSALLSAADDDADLEGEEVQCDSDTEVALAEMLAAVQQRNAHRRQGRQPGNKAAAKRTAVAGKDGKVFPNIQCYGCKSYGHTRAMCPNADRLAAAQCGDEEESAPPQQENCPAR
jgi:hypothetical protein